MHIANGGYLTRFGRFANRFLCDIKIDSTKTLDLLYTGYGNYCACECCFGLTFYLKRPEYIDNFDIESIIINGNSDTKKTIEYKSE